MTDTPVASEPGAERRWTHLDPHAVAEAFRTDPAAGLHPDEAASRLIEHGPNRIVTSVGTSRLRLLLAQFESALVWLLLVAAFVSGAVLGEWVDTSVILAIVILNAILGYVQESRAEDALLALEEMTAPTALVRRGSVERVVDAADVVPGDIVVLESGDRIPADGRLSGLAHLSTDESALTGESLPVRKQIDPIEHVTSAGDLRNMTFAGTTVVTGRGEAIVTATGTATEFGAVATMLDEDEPPTPLTVELDRVGKQIAVFAVIAAIAIFTIGVARDLAAEVMFLTAVALAVAAIPEGLSAVVTITLSRGVSAMAERSAIVRRLPAVEALGSTSVICSDKTGTLTENRIAVQVVELDGLTIDALDGRADPRLEWYERIATLCTDVHRSDDGDDDGPGLLGDPTEVALVASVDPSRVRIEELRAAHPRIDEAVFDSERKRMSTVHPAPDGERVWLLAKGAPEVMFGRCGAVESRSGPRPIDQDEVDRWRTRADEMASLGLRTLALAYRVCDEPPTEVAAAETDLVFVALVGMSDGLRPEARRAIDIAHGAGVDVVMITGDHAVTARAIADQLGILGPSGEVMAGDELRAASTDELAEGIDRYRAFARVDPADKVKIVKAWQRQGAIVAMTGDGVNDAPALRSADIGISMGSGTDVAREASAMVLADDNFATIVAAVRHGRAIFANLRNVVSFLLSANASEVIVMLIAFVVWGVHGEPLLATQLLWINLVTDGLPAVALGVDPAAPDVMDRPPDRQHRILGARRLLSLSRQGAFLAAGALGAFAWGFTIRDLEFEDSRTLMFTALVVVQLLHVFNVRAEGSTLRRVGFTSNPLLLWAVLGSLVLHGLVVYTPVGNDLFEVAPIAAIDLVAIAAISVATFLANAAWRALTADAGPVSRAPTGGDGRPSSP